MSSLVGNISDLIGAADDPNKQKRKVGGELDKDAFLQLLVAQLKHQDPMKPMDDTAFIAEMAQFSSLEQMQNMNKLMEQSLNFDALSQASTMIGKHVALLDADGVRISGQVSEVRQSGTGLQVLIDGKEYSVNSIYSVSATPFTDVPAPPGEGSGGGTDTGSDDEAEGAKA